MDSQVKDLDGGMGKTTDIDLVGEILPVSLLKCKTALEMMATRDELNVCTDDPSVVENVIRLVHSRKYLLLNSSREKQLYRIHILKE